MRRISAWIDIPHLGALGNLHTIMQQTAQRAVERSHQIYSTNRRHTIALLDQAPQGCTREHLA
jgi:hypothetical protein